MGFKQVCGSLPETLSAKDLPERKKAGEYSSPAEC